MQTTSSILMVRPTSFGFNPETAASNAFQRQLKDLTPAHITQNALAEFDNFVDLLRQKGINVVVIEDSTAPEKPDAIFPNNWITMHRNGTIGLYPMHAPNRRLERRPEILQILRQQFEVINLVDFSHQEHEDKFLEGTGSIILDHENCLAYACLSPRTNEDLLQEFCDIFDYKPVTFHAYDHSGGLVYHTNVIMCIGHKFAVLCADTIREEHEQQHVLGSLTNTGHEVILISTDQVRHYAGNMLEVENKSGQHFLVMSEQAFNSLNFEQINAIEKYAEILAVPIFTIEHIGGGSARCMMAEIFLPEKTDI